MSEVLIRPGKPAAAPAPGTFDRLARKMRKVSLSTKLMMMVFKDPRLLASFFRHFWPVANLGKFWLISRYDDVMEVLSRNSDFPVPFGPKFEELDPQGINFILGMEDNAEYRAIHALMMKVFRLEDIPAIGAYAARRAEALVAAGDGVIDCMAGLLTQVPTEIVASYYGVSTDDPDFPLWLLAMNYDSFNLLGGPTFVDDSARAGAAHVGPLLDATIARAKLSPPDDRTILGRMIAAQKDEPKLMTDGVVRATIDGFILGFIPTNNRASGQIMEYLLEHPEMMALAEEAAQSGDDDYLGRVLFEVLRFAPINPGPFRHVARDTVIAAGTNHATKVLKGALLMVATQSASFDPRRVNDPNAFNPNRSVADTMRFGWGQHWCVGFRIAIVQITQTMKPLLLRGNIRRVAGKRGQPGYFGLFYEHLHVTYGS